MNATNRPDPMEGFVCCSEGQGLGLGVLGTGERLHAPSPPPVPRVGGMAGRPGAGPSAE